jgi:hypothetical protein
MTACVSGIDCILMDCGEETCQPEGGKLDEEGFLRYIVKRLNKQKNRG